MFVLPAVILQATKTQYGPRGKTRVGNECWIAGDGGVVARMVGTEKLI